MGDWRIVFTFLMSQMKNKYNGGDNRTVKSNH